MEDSIKQDEREVQKDKENSFHSEVIQAFKKSNSPDENSIIKVLDLLIEEYQKRLEEKQGLEKQVEYDEKHAYQGDFKDLDPLFFVFGFALAEVYVEISQEYSQNEKSDGLKAESEVAVNILYIYSNIFPPLGAFGSVADRGYLRRKANEINDEDLESIKAKLENKGVDNNWLKACLLIFCDAEQGFNIPEDINERVAQQNEAYIELLNFCVALINSQAYTQDLKKLKEEIKKKITSQTIQNLYPNLQSLIDQCSLKNKSFEELNIIFNNLKKWLSTAKQLQSNLSRFPGELQPNHIILCGINALNLLLTGIKSIQVGHADSTSTSSDLLEELKAQIAKEIFENAEILLPNSVVKAYLVLKEKIDPPPQKIEIIRPQQQETWLSRHSFKLSVALFIVLLVAGLILDFTVIGAWLGIILHGIDAFVFAGTISVSFYTVFNFSKVKQFAIDHPFIAISAVIIAGIFTFGVAWKIGAGASAVAWLGVHIPKFGYLLTKAADMVSLLSTKSFTLPPLFEGVSLSVISVGMLTIFRGIGEMVKRSSRCCITLSHRNQKALDKKEAIIDEPKVSISTSFMLKIFGVNVENMKQQPNLKSDEKDNLPIKQISPGNVISYWWDQNKPTGEVQWSQHPKPPSP